MGVIVQKIEQSNNCMFYGEFRQQAFDRGAMLLKVNKIVTGHNAIVPRHNLPFLTNIVGKGN